MPRRWRDVPILSFGTGGEQSDAAEGRISPPHLRRLQNGIVTGPGIVEQVPDWLLADTCKNTTPVENHAVCGIFPFTQQGGASGTVAGVAFSFNATDHKVYLHQISENLTILRSFTAYSSFTGTTPPQITGFEMFGKFYFNEYAREAAASRLGMGVFDPTGAGSVTIPTFDLVAGGAAAAALRFRGISNHRGGTILGWGYRDEETGDIDSPHTVRFSAYTLPDTWIPDTNPANQQSAGAFNVGTLNVPVIACAMSDQFTVIGKETEVFALDGDYGSTFYYRQIGTAYGPVSTAGMVSIGGAAVWMSHKGPAVSNQGGSVELLGLDRVLRKFLNYFDLTNTWATHDSVRHRVVWGLRRHLDDNSVVVTSPFLTELLSWDYLRNEFWTQGVPSPVFCVGVVRGPGQNLVGPSGTVSAITASAVQATSATITWTPGDTSPDVTFEVQSKPSSSGTWTSAGIVAVPTLALTSLTPSTGYDVRVRQIRNGQYSAFTTASALFTTLAASTALTPAGAGVSGTGASQVLGGKTYWQVQGTWTAFTQSGSTVRLYRHAINSPTTASVAGHGRPSAGMCMDDTYELQGAVYYYWLRNELDDGSAQSPFVQCPPFPYTVGPFA